MSYDATVYQIMIASPSDVLEERRIAMEVIYRWNAMHSFRSHLVVLPVMWETHTIPEMGDRPQAIINKQIVSDSDILIGVFWTRLGTPTGKAESGTVEEIEEFIAAGKQAILYFSDREINPHVDLAELQRLREFKASLYERGLVGSFNSLDDFRSKLDAALTRAVTKLAGRSPLQIYTGSKPDGGAQTDETSVTRLFLSRFEPAVGYFESRWIVERDSEPHDLRDARGIVETARRNIEQLRSHAYMIKHPDLQNKLTALLTNMAKLKQHRVYADGGLSYRAFWQTGNELLLSLETLIEEVKHSSSAT